MSHPANRGRPARPAPNLSELRQVATAIERSTLKHRQLVAKRDQLILRALDQGGAHRVIAQAAGVSYQRVGQLAQEHNR